MSLSSISRASNIPERISFQNIVENKDFTLGEGAAFFQDSQGFMWLGGGVALIRYDGYEFRQFDYITDENKPNEKHYPKVVGDIFEDSHHTLWVSTRSGLLRYEPKTEKLIKIADDASQTTKITTAEFFQVIELPTGEILAGSTSGLFVIDANTGQYTLIAPDSKKEHWLHNNAVNSIYLAPSGELWLGTNAGLAHVEWKTKTFTPYRVNAAEPSAAPDDQVKSIVAGEDGKFWLASKNGLIHYDPKTYKTKRYSNNSNDPFSLGGNDARKLLLDSKGLLWIALDGGGLSVYDKEKDSFVNYQAEPGRTGALNTNKVRTVYEDRNGDIWVGNFPSGVNFFDRSTAPITTYTSNASNVNCLSNTSVLAVSEDAKGNLWLGTDGGGLDFFDREKNKFTHFKKNINDPTSLNGDSVLTTLIDSAGLVWVGTWGDGLASYNPADKKFTHYPYAGDQYQSKNGVSSAALNSTTVWSIKEDSKHNLWLGTFYGGVIKFNPKTKRFTPYMHVDNDPTTLLGNFVWTTLEDSKDNIWVGTTVGLHLMNQNDETFTHFVSDPKNPNALSNSSVLSMLEDSKKRLWFGTESGLNVFNRETKTFTAYNKKDGFLDDVIRTLLEGPEGTLWIGTNKGFSSFDPDTKKIKNYNRIAGKLIGVFGVHSGTVSLRGEIILGGVEGVRIFDPRALSENKTIPPVALTDFKIFADSIIPNETNGILKKSINHTSAITLDYTKSMFAFSFSALNFRDPEKNQYAYKLVGFDKDWLNVGNQRTAKYTNLDAGDYVFKVKASNNDGVWNEEGTSVSITILPPIWKSWVAYFLYALVFAIFIANYVITQRNKLKNARKKILLERAMNEKMRNLDALKESFLANTSHELRTPLNGIIGLAESIKNSHGEMSAAEVEQKASMILYSGKRLANIVNDILEFSQLANNELELSLSSVQLRPIITKVLTELKDRISDKPLVILCNVEDNVVVLSNEYRLLQIIHHIIENAIKFTRDGSITIAHQQDAMFDKISVSDTGIGISPENIKTIFDAFQQVDGSAKRAVEGAGLGLSVIQKLVELHKGTMAVESVVGNGTTFHIWLPRLPFFSEREKLNAAENVNNIINTASEKIIKPTPNASVEKTHKAHSIYFNSHLYADAASVPLSLNPNKKYKILVVDDDPVNRMVVKAHLRKQQFNTAEAIDGEDALTVIAEQNDIDLIVLDVMMPRMTGYEACALLRKLHCLHALPVIFLTANHQLGEVVNAFAAGGSDFLTKPVSGDLLIEKVRLHLSLLEEFKEINAISTADISQVLSKDYIDISSHHYLNLSAAIANIVEQIYCLITPTEIVCCWVRNDDNNFECVANLPALPAIVNHAPITPQEFEVLTGVNNNEEKGVALVRCLIEAAGNGRFGGSFTITKNLHCELIFNGSVVVGFIILGASIAGFMAHECQIVLAQCQTHIAAAMAKKQKLQTF